MRMAGNRTIGDRATAIHPGAWILGVPPLWGELQFVLVLFRRAQHCSPQLPRLPLCEKPDQPANEEFSDVIDYAAKLRGKTWPCFVSRTRSTENHNSPLALGDGYPVLAPGSCPIHTAGGVKILRQAKLVVLLVWTRCAATTWTNSSVSGPRP